MCDVSARHMCSCTCTENANRTHKKEDCPGGGGWRDFHFLLPTVVLLFSIRTCLFYKENKYVLCHEGNGVSVTPPRSGAGKKIVLRRPLMSIHYIICCVIVCYIVSHCIMLYI